MIEYEWNIDGILVDTLWKTKIAGNSVIYSSITKLEHSDFPYSYLSFRERMSVQFPW